MPTLPVPLLLLAGPLLGGAATTLLRRWPRVAGLIGCLLAVILWRWLAVTATAPAGALFAGDEWLVLGRQFLLTPGLRLLLGGLIGSVAVLCVLTVFLPQGGLFAALLLLLISPLSAALMVRPFAFSLVALLVAAALLAVLIQGDRAGSTLAATRFLALMGVALPLMLAAEWMLSSGQSTMLGTGSRLLLIGLIVWLAGFPAHIWLAPLLDEAPPLVTVVVAALLQVVFVILAWQIMVATPTLAESDAFLAVLRLSGGAVIVVGGGLALLSRGAGRLLADLLLLDVGALLLVFGSADAPPLAAPLILLGGRFISLLLATCGLALLRRSETIAWRAAPAGNLLFVVGALSLLGMPLTPGYVGRWTAVNVAAADSLWLAALLLAGSAAGLVGVLRWLAGTRSEAIVVEGSPEERFFIRWAVAGAVLLALVAAIMPQLWVGTILEIVALL